jgi:hypothetical protein
MSQLLLLLHLKFLLEDSLQSGGFLWSPWCVLFVLVLLAVEIASALAPL